MGSEEQENFPDRSFLKCFGVSCKFWNVKIPVHSPPVFLFLARCWQQVLCFTEQPWATGGVWEEKGAAEEFKLKIALQSAPHSFYLLAAAEFCSTSEFKFCLGIWGIIILIILLPSLLLQLKICIYGPNGLKGFVLKRIYHILVLMTFLSCPTLLLFSSGLFS